MVRVRITTPVLNATRDAYVDQVQAELIVDGRDYEIRGDASWIDLDIPVLDPESGRKLRFIDSPEDWARHLPNAYRSGDASVTVDALVGAPAHH